MTLPKVAVRIAAAMPILRPQIHTKYAPNSMTQ